ncbi:MAG: polysaccharide deacetylase family protein [Anaerolineales bacterium]
MNPNPVLKKLGFSDTDKVVILHTDDIGMCQASLSAFIDLWEFGGISSGAIMLPCPWAKPAAEYCRTHPGVDMGLHATLNAEWDEYRWPAMSTRDPASGLLDKDGFLWQTSQEAQEHANPAAVATELQFQVQKALEWGVDLTHVDSHMGTVLHPKFMQSYLQAAQKARVPAMLPRGDASMFTFMGMDAETATGAAAFTMQLEEQGLPLVDGMAMMPLDQPYGQLEIAKKLLSELPAGVTHFLFHPSTDTPELRAIAPDWPSRVANYQTFMKPEIKRFIQDQGIQVIGYRHLRDIIRKG